MPWVLGGAGLLVVVVLVLVAAAVGSSGGGGSAQGSPEQTAQSYLDAVGRRDNAAILDLFCGRVRAAIGDPSDLPTPPSDVEISATVRSVDERGPTEAVATFDVLVDGKTRTTRFEVVKEADRWYMCDQVI